MPDELCKDEVSACVEDLHKAAMLEVIDRLIMVTGLNTGNRSNRFKALENINNKSGFLSAVQIHNIEVEDLKVKAAELGKIYNTNHNKEEFILKLKVLSTML